MCRRTRTSNSSLLLPWTPAQVRVDPSNRAVILVTRGNAPTATKPEDPGAIRIYHYRDGVLSPGWIVAPSGRILVVANQSAELVRDGSRVATVPARLTVFRIGSNGKLDFTSQQDVEAGGGRLLFWAGIVSLP